MVLNPKKTGLMVSTSFVLFFPSHLGALGYTLCEIDADILQHFRKPTGIS